MAWHFEAGTRWALFPVLLLGSLVSLQVVLVRRVLQDPSFAVEDHYYAKAMSWNAHEAQERENAGLGWHAATSVAPGAADDADVEVIFGLTARDGRPIRGARIDLEAFAIVRASTVVRTSLTEKAPGEYRVRFPMNRPGQWELSFTAARGAEHFTAVVRRDFRRGTGT